MKVKKCPARVYRCVELEAPTARFTVGQEYPASRSIGTLDIIIGDNRGEHVMASERPRFIIRNECPPGLRWPHPTVPKYAHFEVIKP